MGAIAGLAVLVAVGVGGVLVGARSSGDRTSSAPKAVIVDQIALHDSRSGFRDRVSAALAGAGYRVEVVPPADATVRGYQELPALGGDLVVLRTHSALVQQGSQVTDDVALFTSEPVDLAAYDVTGLGGAPDSSVGAAGSRPADADAPRAAGEAGAAVEDGAAVPAGVDGVARAVATADLPPELLDSLVPVRRFVGGDRTPYIGIGPDFVRDHLNGRFREGSIVILMGCDTLRGRRMSEAFLARGAQAVVGWSDQVSIEHSDRATEVLVRSLAARSSVMDAVGAAMVDVGPDPATGAYLIAAAQ